jgi:hypothetical protein
MSSGKIGSFIVVLLEEIPDPYLSVKRGSSDFSSKFLASLSQQRRHHVL